MKKIIYYFINRLGYNIENKNKRDQELVKPLLKFNHLDNFNLLVLAKNYVLNLDQKFDDLRIESHKDGFMVSFLDLMFYIESLEEFHILNEVFINDDYRFQTNNKAVVIDVGANIGITSMYFSKCNYVDRIYAFEPVENTYLQAKYNFELNSKIHKVEWIKNIGLGNDKRKESFLFNKNTKGNTGIRGVLSESYANDTNAEKVQVQICDASAEIREIVKNIENEEVILKMDCEGAEYEIMENIFKTDVINLIDVILLEWHDKGSRVIEDILLKSGFYFFAKDFSPVAGMIYAYKSKK